MHAHMLICKFTEITIYEDKPSYKAPSFVEGTNEGNF